MAADDRNGKSGGKSRGLKRAVIGIVIVLATGVLGFTALYSPPHGGVPVFVAKIPPPAKVPPMAETDELPMRAGLRPEDTPITSSLDRGSDQARLGDPGEPAGEIDPDDVMIINPAGQANFEGPSATASKHIRLARAPMKGFSEPGEFGQLPKISADGRSPSQVYARPYRNQESRNAPVRIAILINGLGISPSGTREAINRLPEEVTMAFAPYGEDLQSWVNRARSNGHEIMLQIPMEPFDYPDNDPGPHTLLSGLGPEENIGRLRWLLSRFGGYIGITNYMGAKFTSNDAALVPIMDELGRRGLSYLGDGGSPRSRALPVAIAKGLEAKKADLVIDSGQSRAAIEAALRRLESIAKERGSAVGVGTALPVTIETITEWAKSLASRGIALAPVSALLLPAQI